MNFVQEVLNLLVRKQDKDKLELTRDWFEFGRTKTSRLATPAYSPKMTPHAIRYDDLKCNIISGLVEGTGTEHTLPMWSTVNQNNCSVQTIVDSIFSQDPGASEGLVRGNFRVAGNTVLEGDLLVLGQQTIVESTVVQVADNIFRINSTGAGVDAGIEVIMPNGTKTWAWDLARDAWSTFGENAITRDMIIDGKLVMDNEGLVNVVNEAEGLASNDNDQSLATVAAIKDYVDNQARDYVVDVQLTGDDLQFTGVGAAFSGTVNLSKYLDNTDTIDYVSNVVLNGTSLDFAGVGNGFNGSIDLSNFAVDTNTTYDYGAVGAAGNINIALTGSDATNDVVIVQAGTNITLTDNGSNTFTIDAASSGLALSDIVAGDKINVSVNGAQQTVTISHQTTTTTPTTSSTILSGGGTFNAIVDVTHDPYGHITGYDTKTYRLPQDSYISSVSLLGSTLRFSGFGNAFGGDIDLNGLFQDTNDIDYVNNVTLNGDNLVFSGTGNGFSGTIDLSAYNTPETLTTLTYSGNTDILRYVDENGNGHSISGLGPQRLSLSGTDLSIVKADNTIQNTVSLAGIITETLTSLSVNGNVLTYIDEQGTNTDIDLSLYLDDTNLARLTSGTLDAASGIATFTRDDASTFTLDLSSLLDTDTNTTYDFGAVGAAGNINFALGGSDNTNDIVEMQAGTNITLTDNGSNVFTIDAVNTTYTAGTGIQIAGNVISSTITDTNDIDYITNVSFSGSFLNFAGVGNAFNTSVDLSSLNTNDIDYISNVVLNGNSLDFTGVGNSFAGSIDLSSFLDDTNTTYDLDSLQVGSDVAVTLVGSDASSDTITLVAGTNITLTDDGSNNITIDAAGGGSSYTFGTYLTETSGTVNHDATTRSDVVTTAAPAHGDTFTVVDAVTTNTTGHVTGVTFKGVTLPTASEACMFGVNFQPNSSQPVQSQFFVIGQGTPNSPLGFMNNSGEDRRYVLTWTVQLSDGGGAGTGVKAFDYRVVQNSHISPITLMEWNDSQYTVSEYDFSRTYTFTTDAIAPGDQIEIQIAGNTNLTIPRAHLSVVDVTCDSLAKDTARTLPPRS